MKQQFLTQRKGLRVYNTDRTKSKVIPFKKSMLTDEYLECEKFETNVPQITVNKYEYKGEERSLNSSSLNMRLENNLIYLITIETTTDSSSEITKTLTSYIQMKDNKLIWDSSTLAFSITYESATSLKIKVPILSVKKLVIKNIKGYKFKALDTSNIYTNENKSIVKRTTFEDLTTKTINIDTNFHSSAVQDYGTWVKSFKGYVYFYSYQTLLITKDFVNFTKKSLPNRLSSYSSYSSDPGKLKEDHFALELYQSSNPYKYYYITEDGETWTTLTYSEYTTKYPTTTSSSGYSSPPSLQSYSTSYNVGWIDGVYYRQKQSSTGITYPNSTGVVLECPDWTITEYSTDGMSTWKTLSTNWQFAGSCTYANGVYIANTVRYMSHRTSETSAGGTPVYSFKYSKDKINWYDLVGAPKESMDKDWNRVYGVDTIWYFNNMWYAGDYYIDGIYYSKDGINWTHLSYKTITGSSEGYGVSYGDVGYSTEKEKYWIDFEGTIYASSDGINFTKSSANEIKTGNMKFPKYDSNNILTHYDDVYIWYDTSNASSYPVYFRNYTTGDAGAIVLDKKFNYDPRNWITFNGIGFAYSVYNHATNYNYYSTDGKNWTYFEMPYVIGDYGDCLSFNTMQIGDTPYLIIQAEYRYVYLKPFKEVIPGYMELVT